MNLIVDNSMGKKLILLAFEQLPSLLRVVMFTEV